MSDREQITPPVHNREEAIGRVRAIVQISDDAWNVGRIRQWAEVYGEIVDALLPLPEPVNELDDQETVEVRYWRERELNERERAERAEAEVARLKGEVDWREEERHKALTALEKIREKLQEIVAVAIEEEN